MSKYRFSVSNISGSILESVEIPLFVGDDDKHSLSVATVRRITSALESTVDVVLVEVNVLEAEEELSIAVETLGEGFLNASFLINSAQFYHQGR